MIAKPTGGGGDAMGIGLTLVGGVILVEEY